MKRFILLFTFLFTVSSSFLACKDAEREAEVEILEDDMDTEVYEEEVMDEGFGAYDVNTDNMLDRNEFMEIHRTDFSEWDADADSFLNEDEYYMSTFVVADANEDDMIDEAEWNEGLSLYYTDYAAAEDWDTYDLDNDGFLDYDEWNAGFADTTWFADFDMDDDDLVDYDEWNEGLFSDWDTDADGFLNENEYSYYYNRATIDM